MFKGWMCVVGSLCSVLENYSVIEKTPPPPLLYHPTSSSYASSRWYTRTGEDCYVIEDELSVECVIAVKNIVDT